MGVLLGSVWAARGSGFFSPSVLVALNCVASVALPVVFTVGWEALRLGRRRLLGGAAIGHGLYLVCVALAISDQVSVLALPAPAWFRRDAMGRYRALRCLHGHDGTYIGIKAGCYDMYLIMVYS